MAVVNVDAEKRAYKIFIDAGMTAQGACGLIGNLEAESDGFYTNRLEYFCAKKLEENGKVYTDKIYTDAIDSGKISRDEFLNPFPGKRYGYGIAQWTSPERKAGLYDLAKKKGVSIADESMQLEYLLYELKNSYSSVLKVLKTTNSIREASDVVLKKFEIPADTSESVCASRAKRGQKFYDDHVKEKEDKSMSHYISNCGHDEKNGYSGGNAGDQTGGEWNIIPWYSRPWNCVLRHPDPEVRRLHAEMAEAAAKNNCIGYDQYQRDTFGMQLKAAGDNPAKITVKCETDCSKGIIDIAKAIGRRLNRTELKNINATYTGNMRSGFKAAGYQVLTDAKYLNSPDYLLPGDILLNDTHHTATNITVGKKAGSESSGSTANNKTNSVMSTTGGKYMFEVGNVQNGSKGNDVKLLQRLLKSNGCKGADGKALTIDGDCGENTVYAINTYQKKKGLTVDGCAGPKTWKSILLR